MIRRRYGPQRVSSAAARSSVDRAHQFGRRLIKVGYQALGTTHWARAVNVTSPSIGTVLDEYESEPDALVRQICSLTGVCDLRLTFRARTNLEGFLRAYKMQLTH